MIIRNFKKKPVIIDAIHFKNEHCIGDICKFVGKTVVTGHDDEGNIFLTLNTLEGPMRVKTGSFIIKGISGEFYGCRESIFWMTYDEVESRIIEDEDAKHMFPEIDWS